MTTMYSYYRNCVGWPRADVTAEGGLSDMVYGAIEISRRTFLGYVDRDYLQTLEFSLGYTRDLPMANDYHVTYHRSMLHDRRVYFFKHSAIEYVFTPPGYKEST